MESINKIKVFVSSKCDDQNTGHKYSDVRNGIKERLESTGLAEVYVFEEESASTLSAEQHYSFALESCMPLKLSYPFYFGVLEPFVSTCLLILYDGRHGFPYAGGMPLCRVRFRHDVLR